MNFAVGFAYYMIIELEMNNKMCVTFESETKVKGKGVVLTSFE
jgi:hypothetical protein